jgi:tetratricopeptide (TPR) repeat protein
MAERETFTLTVEADLAAAKKQVAQLEKQLEELRRTAAHDIAVDVEIDGDQDIEDLSQDLDRLDDTDVKVDADADEATSTIRDLLDDVDKLDNEQATIKLALARNDLAQQVADIADDVTRLDATDAEVDIAMANGDALLADIEQIDAKLREIGALDVEPTVLVDDGTAQGDLDSIAAKAKEVDSIDPRIDVTADTGGAEGGLHRVEGGLKQVSHEGDQSKSVLANMAGNTAQDLGELGGVVGSLGVGIGQLAEYATEGNISLNALSSIAGPAALLTAISVGVGLFSKWKAAAAELAENTRQVTEAFDEGVGSVDDWGAAVDAAFETGTAGAQGFSREILRALTKALEPDQLDDLRLAMDELGLTFGDLAELSQTAESNFAAYATAQIDAAGASAAVAGVLGPLVKEYGNADEILTDLNTRVAAGAPLFDEYGNAIPIDDVIAFVEANKPFLNSLDEIEEGFNRVDIEAAAGKFLSLEHGVDGVTRAMVDEARAAATNADGTVNQTKALGLYIEAQQRRNRLAADSAKRLDEDAGAMAAVAQATADAEAETARMTFTQQELNDALQALEDPLQTMPGHWSVLIDDMRDGKPDLETFLQLINDLAEATGKEPGDILAIVKEQAEALNAAFVKGNIADPIAALIDQTDALATGIGDVRDAEDEAFSTDTAQAIADVRDAIKEADDAAAAFAETVGEASIAANMSGARLDAIEGVFDTFNQFGELDTAQRLGDIDEAFGAIDDAARAFPDSILPFDLVPDSWDEVLNMPDDLKGISDAIGQFSQATQTQMATAFEFGGPDAMRETANDIRRNFHEPFMQMMERNGATTEEANAQWRDFLGTIGLTPDQVDVQIELAIDQQKLQLLRDIGSGQLTGDAKLNFDIAIANNDPDTALAILNAQLASGLHPQSVSLTVDPDTGQIEVVRSDLAQPVTVPVEPEMTSLWDSLWSTPPEPVIVPATVDVKAPDAGKVDKLISAVADRKRTATIGVKAPDAGKVGTLLDDVAEDKRTATIGVKAPDAGAVSGLLDAVADTRQAYINAVARVAGASSALNGLAETRTAHINAVAHTSDAERALNNAARSRTSTVTQVVRTVSSSSGQGGAVPGTTAAPTTATVTALPAPISVTINAAVIGDRYSVQRAVTRSVRGAVRLSGARFARAGAAA